MMLVEKAIENRKDRISELTCLVTDIEISDYRALKISSAELHGDTTELEEVLKSFCNSITPGDHFHIYIFSWSGESGMTDIYNEFRAYKGESSRKHQLSKDNELDKNKVSSQVLYVGSKQKDLRTRLRQHLGLVSPSVYSLHLRKWFPEGNELLVNVYSVPRMKPEDLEFLEQGFWVESKPLFGKKSGH